MARWIAEKIGKDFLKKLLGDFVVLSNFRLDRVDGVFTGTLEELQLKDVEINTLLADVPLKLASGRIGKATAELSFRKDCRLHLDGVELFFLVNPDTLALLKLQLEERQMRERPGETPNIRQSDGAYQMDPSFLLETEDDASSDDGGGDHDDDQDEEEDNTTDDDGEPGKQKGVPSPTQQKRQSASRKAAASSTFQALKEKIREILRRVEHVEVSDLHVLLLTEEDRGKRELHLHFEHLRYADATPQPAGSAPTPTASPKPAASSASSSSPSSSFKRGTDSSESVAAGSRKVVKTLEVEGFKVVAEEFTMNGDQVVELKSTKLLHISVDPRHAARAQLQRAHGGAAAAQQATAAGRLTINLTLGQTVTIDEVDIAFDKHRIDAVLSPRHLKFMLDLAARLGATEVPKPPGDTGTPAADASAAAPTTSGYSAPVYAFPKCTMRFLRGSVILLEKDSPVQPAGQRLDLSGSGGGRGGYASSLTTSMSSSLSMSFSSPLQTSMSQREFAPFDNVPRIAWSFDEAVIAVSSGLLPPRPGSQQDKQASGARAPSPPPSPSSLMSRRRSLLALPPPPRVTPPSSQLLIEVRMKDCDLVEYGGGRANQGDVGGKKEELFRLDIIKLGQKEIVDGEEENDEYADATEGGEKGHVMVRFKKKLRIEEREVEPTPAQSFDDIDAEELAEGGASWLNGDGGSGQYRWHSNNGESAANKAETELMVWEETRLAVETANLDMEVDTKIAERLARFFSALDSSTSMSPPSSPPPPVSSPPPEGTSTSASSSIAPPSPLELSPERREVYEKEVQRLRDRAAHQARQAFDHWAVQRDFSIDVGARRKLRLQVHFYDPVDGKRRADKLDLLLFDCAKVRFATCLSSLESSDDRLREAYQGATILEFDFENAIATITSPRGYPKEPFFRASMADTTGERVTPLEITLKSGGGSTHGPAAPEDNLAGRMLALVEQKGQAFTAAEVEAMAQFQSFTSQLAGVAIRVRFPFSEVKLEKTDYDALMTLLANLSSSSSSSPPPAPSSPPLPRAVPSSLSQPPVGSPEWPHGQASHQHHHHHHHQVAASVTVEVSLRHTNIQLLESRSKDDDDDDDDGDDVVKKEGARSAHKPFHLHFVDVERLDIRFTSTHINDKAANWLWIDANSFLLYERLVRASSSASGYTPATLMVNRNPFVHDAAGPKSSSTTRPIFASVFLMRPQQQHSLRARMDFNDLIIHHKAGYQWHTHLGAFFSGSDEPAAEDEDNDRATRNKNEKPTVTQLHINLPNLELEYSPTLVPGNAFVSLPFLQVDLLLFSGRKEPRRVTDIPRMELNIVAKPRKAGHNVAIRIAAASPSSESDASGSAALREDDDGAGVGLRALDQDREAFDEAVLGDNDNEMARQRRLHWRSNGKRYLKAGVLNSAFSVRLKSRLFDGDDEQFLHLLDALKAAPPPSPGIATRENENESEGESDDELNRSGIIGRYSSSGLVTLAQFCEGDDDTDADGGDGNVLRESAAPAPRRVRKRAVGRWRTKLTLCPYDINDNQSNTEAVIRPLLLNFCPDSLAVFADLASEALLPADLVLEAVDPDARAMRELLLQRQRQRRQQLEEQRKAAAAASGVQPLASRSGSARRKGREDSMSSVSSSGPISRESSMESSGSGFTPTRTSTSHGGGLSGFYDSGGLEASLVREGLVAPDIAEKIRRQDEVRIEEARRRGAGRRSRSSSLTEPSAKTYSVSEARLQSGAWFTDSGKVRVITDYWHTPGDSRLLPASTSASSFCVAVKSGLSVCVRLYGGLDWPELASADAAGTAVPQEALVARQKDAYIEAQLKGLNLRFDEFIGQPLAPRRIALAVHDLTVIDCVGPAPRPRADLLAHNKRKDRLAETAMLYLTLTCHKEHQGKQKQEVEDDEDEPGQAKGRGMGVAPEEEEEEVWEGKLELPAPLRIKIHENALKLLLFSHHPFFPLATTELPATAPMLIRDFRVGRLGAKIDWSGWSYSDELIAALTPENLGGIIVDRSKLVGLGVFLGGWQPLTAISLRWGERRFSDLYFGWGELMGKVVEQYVIDVATRKPHKVIGAVGGIRHVKEAVRMGSEAIAANLPAVPVSVALPDVSVIGDYINTETISQSAFEYASNVGSFLSGSLVSSSSSWMSSSSSLVSSFYSQAQQALTGAPEAGAAGSADAAAAPPASPDALKARQSRRGSPGGQKQGRRARHRYEDEEEEEDSFEDVAAQESEEEPLVIKRRQSRAGSGLSGRPKGRRTSLDDYGEDEEDLPKVVVTFDDDFDDDEDGKVVIVQDSDEDEDAPQASRNRGGREGHRKKQAARGAGREVVVNQHHAAQQPQQRTRPLSQEQQKKQTPQRRRYDEDAFEEDDDRYERDRGMAPRQKPNTTSGSGRRSSTTGGSRQPSNGSGRVSSPSPSKAKKKSKEPPPRTEGSDGEVEISWN